MMVSYASSRPVEKTAVGRVYRVKLRKVTTLQEVVGPSDSDGAVVALKQAALEQGLSLEKAVSVPGVGCFKVVLEAPHS